MRRWRRWFVLMMSLIALLLVAFNFWIWEGFGYVKSSLESQYVLTAESLMNSPFQRPVFMTVDPPESSTISSLDWVEVGIILRPDELCKNPNVGPPMYGGYICGDKSEYWAWTQFFINTQRIPKSITFAHSYLMLPDDIAYTKFQPKLEPGLHLFRVQFGTSMDVLFNPDPALSYEWAYRVE